MRPMSQGSVEVACRAPITTHRSSLELAIAPSAVRRARHWTANVLSYTELTEAGYPDKQGVIDTAVLLVSELVTNAIRAVSQSGGVNGADRVGGTGGAEEEA